MSSEDRNERSRHEPSPIDIVRLLAFELHRLHQAADESDIQNLRALQVRAGRIERKIKRLAKAFALLDNATASQ